MNFITQPMRGRAVREVILQHVAGEITLHEQGAEIEGGLGRTDTLRVPEDVDVGQFRVGGDAAGPFEDVVLAIGELTIVLVVVEHLSNRGDLVFEWADSLEVHLGHPSVPQGIGIAQVPGIVGAARCSIEPTLVLPGLIVPDHGSLEFLLDSAHHRG